MQSQSIDATTYPYSVVQFDEEEGMRKEVVPTCWLEEDEVLFCWWPPQKEYRKCMIARSLPVPGVWSLHAAHVLHLSRDRHSAEAHLKVSLAELDVDLYSEATKRQKLGPEVNLAATGTQLVACGSCANLKSSVDQLTLEVAGLRLKQNEAVSTILNLQQMVQQLLQKFDVNSATVEVDGLPLTNAESLNHFERLLDSNKEFKRHVKFLGRFGGRDVNDVTRRILPSILSNDFACQMNWAGANGKLGLKFYPRFLQLLAGAVRQNPATKEAKLKEVEEVLKKWIRTAADRDGGRARRKPVVVSYISDIKVEQ